MKVAFTTSLLSLLLPSVVHASAFRQLLGSVTMLELIDSATDQKVADITNGSIIDLSTLNGVNESKLNIRAATEGDVSSVRFDFNGQANFRTEGSPPFALCGDSNGDYHKCASLGLGLFTVTAIPLETDSGDVTGKTGAPFTASFEIVAGGAPVSCDSQWSDFIVVDHSPEEDSGEIDCGSPNGFVSGVQCVGHYCDDIRLLCKHCYSCTYPENSSYWTEVFSDEDLPKLCDDDHFMTGLSCNGHYCDNLMMQCTDNAGRTAGADCAWSEWISEEGTGTIEVSEGGIRGIECKGHFCDSKRFFVCPVVDTC